MQLEGYTVTVVHFVVVAVVEVAADEELVLRSKIEEDWLESMGPMTGSANAVQGSWHSRLGSFEN